MNFVRGNNMARILANIGDFFSIPLPGGKFAYGQYVYFHRLYATLVRITNLRSSDDASFEEIAQAGDLFPPVFVGFNVPVRQKLWRVIGNVPLTEFRFPLFRCRQGLERGPGIYQDWLLWDGENYTPLGALPEQYRNLEYLVGWSSDALERRIATGKNEPYDSMI